MTETKLHGTEAALSFSSVKQFIELGGHSYSPWTLFLFVPEQELEQA